MNELDAILRQREGVYGNFLRQATITAELKHAMQSRIAWNDALAPDQREALEMIALKLARIINGDPNYPDNWYDIAGYAQLVANRLAGKDDPA